MASKVAIYNLGVTHLGSTALIADVSENSTEARLMNLVFDTCLDAVLRDFNWPFARVTKALQLIAEDPNINWKYAYRYPVDCLKFQKILSGIRNDFRETRVPTEIGNDSTGPLIYSDMSEATGVYTKRVTNTQHFPPDFTMALSFRIAMYIAPALTAGDPFKMGDRAARMYQAEIAKASAQALNEEQPDVPVESELIRARE